MRGKASKGGGGTQVRQTWAACLSPEPSRPSSPTGSSSGDAEAQWQALARVVLAWAAEPGTLVRDEPLPPPTHLPRPSGASSGTTTTATTPQRQLSTSTLTAAAAKGPEAWEQLLQSLHHARHGSRFAWAPKLQAQQAAAVQGSPAASGRDEVWRALQALHSGA